MQIPQLAYQIAEYIKAEGLPEGTRLPGRRLAEQFRVSRTPIERALRLLEEHRIVSSSGKGFVVHAPLRWVYSFSVRPPMPAYLSGMQMTSTSPAKPWVFLLGFLILCFAIAGISGAVTATSVHDWYPTLQKPVFNPPNWLFGPVWTTLYAMIGIAGWRVWARGALDRPALTAYGAQLALNFAWSILFFGAHRIGLALVDILALVATILVTIRLFARRDRAAAWLLVPYAAWVGFASVLNIMIWYLN